MSQIELLKKVLLWLITPEPPPWAGKLNPTPEAGVKVITSGVGLGLLVAACTGVNKMGFGIHFQDSTTLMLGGFIVLPLLLMILMLVLQARGKYQIMLLHIGDIIDWLFRVTAVYVLVLMFMGKIYFSWLGNGPIEEYPYAQFWIACFISLIFIVLSTSLRFLVAGATKRDALLGLILPIILIPTFTFLLTKPDQVWWPVS